MESLVKILMLVLFLLVIFCRPYFPSGIIYWLSYFFMFVLVVLLWFIMFWISKRKNALFIGKTPDSDFFVGMVSSDTREDLTRGRMSFTDSDIIFITKNKKELKQILKLKKSEVQSVGFGKVAGIRRGFIINTVSECFSFVCYKIYKNPNLLYKALGWNIQEKDDEK